MSKFSLNNLPNGLGIKLMVVAMVIMAFVIGTLYQQVKNLQGGQGGTLGTTTTTQTGTQGIKNDKNQSGRLAEFLKPAIDPDSLKSCLDSGKYDQRLTADMALAGNLFTSAGMSSGTPGFFVNSVAYGGAYSWTLNLSNPQTRTEIPDSNMKLISENALQGKQPTSNLVAGTKIDINQIKSLWTKDVIKIGDANSKLLFVEIGDPSCPYCHIASGKNPELNRTQGFTLVEDGGTYVAPITEMRKLVDSGQASFAYLYYPGHANGEMGMKALYCASEQGKFWEVHDLLMTNAGYTLINGN